FKYERTYEPTEQDFTADIVRMKAEGVKAVVLVAVDVKGAARIAAAAAQQHWKPDLFLFGASAYDPQLIPLAGADALEGDYLFLPTALYLGEDTQVPEVALFNT